MPRLSRRRAFIAAFAVPAIAALSAFSRPAGAGEPRSHRPRRIETPFAHVLGVWEQEAKGRLIARKEIYIDENGLPRMRYVWMDDGVFGGEYSILDMDDYGDILTYEDYGDSISRHILTPGEDGTIAGDQTLFPGPASVPEYVMRRAR